MKFDTVAEKCMMIVTPTIFSEYKSGTILGMVYRLVSVWRGIN